MEVKFILFFTFFIAINCAVAQTSSNSYKDKKEFKEFRKRRIEHSGEQIIQLRQQGALIVILHTGKIRINALNRIGKQSEALKFAETQFHQNKISNYMYIDNRVT